MIHWLHALLVFTAYQVWEYWIKRTEKIAANSTAELISWGLKRLFKKGDQKMEQKLGSFGDVQESYAKGVASLSATAALPATEFGLQVSVKLEGSIDAKVLVAYLAAKIGGPVPAEVASFLETALALT